MKIGIITIVTLTALQAVLAQPGRPVPPSHPDHHHSFPECEEGFFYDKKSSECQKCHFICKTCSGFKLNCNSCAEGYYFDPLVQVHCLKEGAWAGKFHHFDEIFKHVMPDHFHFLPAGGLISWVFSMAFMMITAILLYICVFCSCYFGRGVNVNEVEMDEFCDLVAGKTMEEILRKREERNKRRYQAVGQRGNFVENTAQIV